MTDEPKMSSLQFPKMRTNLQAHSADSKRITMGLPDVIGVVVLVAEFGMLFVVGIRHWSFAFNSLRITLTVYSVLCAGLVFWALRLWRVFHAGILGWLLWTLGFGAVGASFLYLSLVRNYGRGFSFVYGPFFVAQALIGVAGLARSMSIVLRKQPARIAG